MTDFDQIRELLDLMDERDLDELEIERSGLRVRLRKRKGLASGETTEDDESSAPPSADPPTAEASVETGLFVVKSPIVGTFYHAPEPGSDPFVTVGSRVQKGQILCIIEAMKLMNEIDADQDGVIAEVFVENGQPVQYGEPLFAIKLA